MEALSTLLTRERVLVDLLVMKLVTLRQLLVIGETRFLAWAAEEVERAAAGVRAVELERAVLVSSVGESRGLGTDPSLAELVADAPEPWRTVLGDAREGLQAGTAEVAELLAATKRLADAGARSIGDTLQRVGGEAADAPLTYGASGQPVGAPAPRVWQDL